MLSLVRTKTTVIPARIIASIGYVETTKQQGFSQTKVIRTAFIRFREAIK